jgi:ApaG protein
MSASPSATTVSRTFGSDAVTRGVRVRTRPFFVPDQSDADEGKFLFAYQITISNESDIPVQLLSRHWIIIDGDGDREEVKGPGVVGETPVIQPGKSYAYTSACPLQTPWGTMEGTYQMRDGNGESFDAAIARFVLAMEATPIAVSTK